MPVYNHKCITALAYIIRVVHTSVWSAMSNAPGINATITLIGATTTHIHDTKALSHDTVTQ